MMRIRLAFLFLLCWMVEGTLVRTIDGDTFVADLKVWQQMRATEHVRSSPLTRRR